jgi:hypothetical protein
MGCYGFEKKRTISVDSGYKYGKDTKYELIPIYENKEVTDTYYTVNCDSCGSWNIKHLNHSSSFLFQVGLFFLIFVLLRFLIPIIFSWLNLFFEQFTLISIAISACLTDSILSIMSQKHNSAFLKLVCVISMIFLWLNSRFEQFTFTPFLIIISVWLAGDIFSIIFRRRKPEGYILRFRCENCNYTFNYDFRRLREISQQSEFYDDGFLSKPFIIVIGKENVFQTSPGFLSK